MRGLFESLRNMGMNAADALDFIPGFDPVPERQGAVRGMFGSLAPHSAAQTPPIIPQGMTTPKQVQPVQKRGMMAQPPGGVPMTGLERYSKPLTLPQLLTMSGDSRRAYNQGRDAHSATQAQMQFDMQQARQERQQERQQDWAEKSAANVMRQSRIDALMGMGLNQYEAEIYADDPSELRKQYAENYAPQSLSPNDEVYTFGNDADPLTNSNTDTVNEIDQQNADAAMLSAEASMVRANRPASAFEMVAPDGTIVRTGSRADQSADAAIMKEARQKRMDLEPLLNTLYATRANLLGPDGEKNTEDDLQTSGLSGLELQARQLIPGESDRQTRLETADGLAKEYGIDKLSGIGGNDTERELLTAIQTGANIGTGFEANLGRIDRQIAVVEFIGQTRAEFMSRWRAEHGSLGSVAQSGPYQGLTYDEALSEFQREEAGRRKLFGAEPVPAVSQPRDQLNDAADLLPPDKAARMRELQAKRDAGTLGGAN